MISENSLFLLNHNFVQDLLKELQLDIPRGNWVQKGVLWEKKNLT